MTSAPSLGEVRVGAHELHNKMKLSCSIKDHHTINKKLKPLSSSECHRERARNAPNTGAD